MYSHILKFIGCIGIFISISVCSVYAQENVTMGVSTTLTLENKTVREGDIVSNNGTTYSLSAIESDPHIVGIVSKRAAIAFQSVKENAYPVISTGTVPVNVSTLNGPIKAGDYITTSTLPGVGVKANKTGYVVGRAITGYTQQDPQKIGQISVTLLSQFMAVEGEQTVQGSLGDIFRLSQLAQYEKPLTVFKYVVALAIVVISISFGFLTAGRAASKGVEAIGRNPLASRWIQLGIILNVGITVSMVLGGMVLAVVIIRI